MRIDANNYDDFLSVTNGIGRIVSVFYFVPSNQTGVAFIYSVTELGETIVQVGISTGGPTTSQILTDFPNAIALSSSLTVTV